jgi:hypothetical protein
MKRSLAFDCLFPNQKSVQAQLKVAYIDTAIKPAITTHDHAPIRKKNALKQAACHMKVHYNIDSPTETIIAAFII